MSEAFIVYYEVYFRHIWHSSHSTRIWKVLSHIRITVALNRLMRFNCTHVYSHSMHYPTGTQRTRNASIYFFNNYGAKSKQTVGSEQNESRGKVATQNISSRFRYCNLYLLYISTCYIEFLIYSIIIFKISRIIS